MLGALWLASCGAPSPFQADSEPQREWPEPSPALWEATSPDGAKGWLFGTVHALPDGVEWNSGALNEAIESADLLMVEIADLDASTQAAIEFESRAYSDGLEPLPRRVGPEYSQAIAKLIDDADMEESDFARTETWAAALMLGNAMRCTQSGNGVDRALIAQFERVQAMEGFAMQFDIFDNLPEEAQGQLLLTAAQSGDCERAFDRTELWLTGDTVALMQELESSFGGNTDLRLDLLERRNEWFAARLARYQELNPDEAVLLAVGAGHMPGPDGVVALLEAEGYTVTRIQ
ncbi:TraB/GumN family protein [Aurantiacibacter sediminis]|uniref:TraB/GumN family protein n=1 Tax=Aurantiacibacter sediminis TaxID=2793064 RepID=A0ABS0N3W7_9SPHN|nr:TraB/GumN family protein [Aurantiacibacter sediminis]MBH5322666.1 TraB/GumN family protein [Aurantiacibacter sediminis]